MQQIVILKVPVPHNIKIGYNSHDLAFAQLAGLDAFPGTIAQLMCLQLSDKYSVKIIDVTENFNKLFSMLFMDSSFFG